MSNSILTHRVNTALVPHAGPVAVNTFGGRVHVGWDAQAVVTPLWQLPFLPSFCVRLGGRFEVWVESCPLRLTSQNAQSTRDVLGTAILSVLTGHRCYAHMSALRGDTINASVLAWGGGQPGLGAPQLTQAR